MQPFFELRGIWEDESLFEVEVKTATASHSGKAACYTTRDEVAELAILFRNFSGQRGEILSFSTYGHDDISYFSIQLIPLDSLGHIVAMLTVASIHSPVYARKEMNKVELEFPVDLAQIDNFAQQLYHLAAEPVNTVCAILNGRI